MARKVLCENCQEILEPTSKDYQVCGNCGEFNWIGVEDKVETEPDLKERLMILQKKLMKAND